MSNSDYIGLEFDVKEVYHALRGYVSPPFPAEGNLRDQLLPSNPLGTASVFIDQFKKTALGVEMVMPLKMSIPEFEWEFDIEPIISIRGANKIIRRYPNRSKGQGSIKERWSSDDYQITIKGFLADLTNTEYPEYQVKSLRRFLEYKGAITVENPLFRIFGIQQIAIENFNVPATPGLALQEFQITAYSDIMFNSLLVEV